MNDTPQYSSPTQGAPEALIQQMKQQSTARTPQQAHDVDYIIHGHDMQCVEIVLDPAETVIAEAGSLMYMENGIQMNTRVGDGSESGSGVMGSLLSAAKRSLTGEQLFMTQFTNAGKKKAKIAFAAPYPGCIVPLDLGALGTVMCQKEGFLCGAKGVSVGFGFTKRISAGMFGGDGYILQKLEGDGMAFIHAGGSVIEKTLGAGELCYVDTGSVVGFQKSVDFSIAMVKGVSNMVFGGEDMFLTTLKGPGKVWVQSMPWPRLLATIRVGMQTTLTKKELKRQKKLNKLAK